MIAPDKKEFERLIKDTMFQYSHMISEMETAWEVYRDDYGEALFAAPYLKVKLKDDADVIADLQNNKAIRVIH